MLCLLGWALLHGHANGVAFAGALNLHMFPGALLRCTTEFMLGMFSWRLRLQCGWAAWLGGSNAVLAMTAALLALTPFSGLDLLFVVVTCGLLIGLSFMRSSVASVLGTRPCAGWAPRPSRPSTRPERDVT